MKVIVLGASGMLGSMLLDHLSRDSKLQIVATARATEAYWQPPGAKVEWRTLDAEHCDTDDLRPVLQGARWAINAIGVIKPYIRDTNMAEVERATHINALFPHTLARAAEQAGCRVLQIATDCVYSGAKGGYQELDAHDPLDVYGKTKSLGEVYAPHVHHLRCSIIGPEPKRCVSLLEWFLGQTAGANLSGYVNHRWNGVTTLHFAQLCQGLMAANLQLPHVQHIVPQGEVTKCELLESFARHYGREDLTINPTTAAVIIDRTLKTADDALNRALWQAAGYAEPPSVPQMIAELARFDYHGASR